MNFLDALYFSIQCLITTGFGDIVPTSTGARIFMILYFVPGILSFAILICFTRSVALEALEDGFKARERSILKSLKRRKAGEQAKTRDEKLVASSYEEAIVKLSKERNRDFRSQVRSLSRYIPLFIERTHPLLAATRVALSCSPRLDAERSRLLEARAVDILRLFLL